MDNEEKKYFRDIKMALRKLSEIGVPVTPIIKAVMNAESELAESEDERIRKEMLDYFKDKKEKLHYLCFECGDVKNAPFSEAKQIDDFLAYLEKQKEQPKEGLIYRLNGLMQDYIKDGKDEEEREHRRKCNLLFWDALADETFFEQKEQKPAEWSEEDEKFFKTALWHISYSISNGKTTDCHCDTTDWLKGVKERLKHLRPSWKPSEEQMEALESAVKLYKDTHFEIHHEKIVSLYEQLKAL